jgi:AcrR family transcriptional regulator
MARPSKRDELLQAAARVVAEHGYSALTLDAVASASGFSRGGLLYHFPTKEALIAALLEDLTSGFEAAQVAEHASDPTAPGAWTRAYLRASTTGPSESAQSTVLAVLAAGGHDASILTSIQQRYAQWVQRLADDGLPEVDAQVVRLAADGLWAAETFGLQAPDHALRARIITRLEQLAGGDRT